MVMVLVEEVPVMAGKFTGTDSVWLVTTFTTIGDEIPAPPNSGPASFRVVFCSAWLNESQSLKFVLLAALPLLMVKLPPELFIWA